MGRKFIVSPKQNRTEKRSELISVMLLSENHGYRMKSYGPISLVKVGGKTLLEHQIEAISSAFINFEVVVCAGFETSKIYSYIKSNWGPSVKIRIVENQMYYHSNCCESIRLCMNNIMTEKVIICGGGVLLTPEYLKSLNLGKPSILFQDKEKENNFEVGVIDSRGKLETLSLAVKDRSWTEMLYLNSSRLINSFYGVVSKPEYKTKFFFEAINGWVNKKHLHVNQNNGAPIVKVNNIKSLKKVNEI
jgi:choline kinase